MVNNAMHYGLPALREPLHGPCALIRLLNVRAELPLPEARHEQSRKLGEFRRFHVLQFSETDNVRILDSDVPSVYF